jgi:hypothetical protein
MDLQELELHDAVMFGQTLDPIERTAEVRIAYYPTKDSKERVGGVLRFAGVSHFHQLADLVELEDNASAGNVGYWVPSVGPGITYIYLVRGLIAVTATSVELIAAA